MAYAGVSLCEASADLPGDALDEPKMSSGVTYGFRFWTRGRASRLR